MVGQSAARVKQRIRDVMQPALIQLLEIEEKNGNGKDSVIFTAAHRWGVAKPKSSVAGECFVDVAQRFAACGDYFGDHFGTVEGAALSGAAAAAAIIAHAR
ncbi:hypothetical protein M885DRAFT_497102 [Pelagophyceae sp. CCMP2097]|nr:hypothetical protein M885DRAFT_497102 [Pelagophyceae sp. CCMP2097]